MGKLLLIISLLLFSSSNLWSKERFGEQFCQSNDYSCIKIKSGDTWNNLFDDDQIRDIVRRVNRMNIELSEGMVIAIPKNVSRLTIYDVSPFPRYIDSDGQKKIFVSQKKLAWAAYDDNGELVWWGPISVGAGQCRNSDGNCLTPSGSFRVIRKQGIECVSTVFPMRANGQNGGAIMPYCMHFLRGFALHGSETLPGFPDSHGCVRLFIEDARWLNEEFIELPGVGKRGTRVIVAAG